MHYEFEKQTDTICWFWVMLVIVRIKTLTMHFLFYGYVMFSCDWANRPESKTMHEFHRVRQVAAPVERQTLCFVGIHHVAALEAKFSIIADLFGNVGNVTTCTKYFISLFWVMVLQHLKFAITNQYLVYHPCWPSTLWCVCYLQSIQTERNRTFTDPRQKVQTAFNILSNYTNCVTCH